MDPSSLTSECKSITSTKFDHNKIFHYHLMISVVNLHNKRMLFILIHLFVYSPCLYLLYVKRINQSIKIIKRHDINPLSPKQDGDNCYCMTFDY